MNFRTRKTGSPCAKKKKVLQKFKVSRETSQRIAFIVQQVIHAWDCKARSMGFNDCEDMIYPYITLVRDEREMCFSVLISGFSNKQQNHTIKANAGASHVPEKVSPRAFRRVTVVDNTLREAAKLVLRDIRFLFGDLWTGLRKLRRRSSPISKATRTKWSIG